MVILEHEFCWQKMWWFLSLDRTRAFFRDMWVPVEDPAEFQEQVRNQLRQIDDQTYYHHPQVGNAIVHSWFSSAYGTDQQELMVLWADHVFITSTPNRLAEDLWGHLISFATRPSEEDVPAWARDLFSKLETTDRGESKALEKRIDGEFSSALSEWDRINMPRVASGEENIRDKIGLITRCNTFISSWEVYCSNFGHQELQALYELGQRLAEKRNMADQGVSYPGSWRFELRPFIKKLHP